ncbi:MAG: hypothetical protein OES59_04760, partial [Gammaproteobacteria bacterium]|nr:hypothetical protein [Gammaproteobacteria bacterium]
MNRILAVAAAALVLALAPQLATAQSADADMREQFEAVINGLNDNKFEPFQRAVNETALINRIFGTQVIDADAREQFAAGFSGTLQELFISSFPRARTQAESGGEIIGTIIAFQFQDGQGRAIVRYAGKGYRFSYHSYELTRSRNKL